MDPTLVRLLLGGPQLQIACLLAAIWFVDRSAGWSRHWAIFHGCYGLITMLGGGPGPIGWIAVLDALLVGAALATFGAGTLAFRARPTRPATIVGAALAVAALMLALPEPARVPLPTLLIPCYLAAAALITPLPSLTARVAGIVLLLRALTNAASVLALASHQPVRTILLLTFPVNELVSLSLVIAALIDHRDRLVTARNQLLAVNEHLTRLTRRLEEQSDDYSRARDRADAASQAKSMFLANMSHELRTPLNAVIGYSELIQLTGAAEPGGRVHAYLGNISEAGKHLLTIVDDILEISRTDLNAIEITPEPVPVEQLVDGVIRMVSITADEKRQQISRRIPPALAVRGEHRLLHQALLNIVANAVKFTPAGGLITIEARPLGEPGEVELRVTDTGPGIPADLREQAFDRFWQRADALTRDHTGVGLGLSIARRFIELNGGSIAIEDGGQAGACFVIRLPSA